VDAGRRQLLRHDRSAGWFDGSAPCRKNLLPVIRYPDPGLRLLCGIESLVGFCCLSQTRQSE